MDDFLGAMAALIMIAGGLAAILFGVVCAKDYDTQSRMKDCQALAVELEMGAFDPQTGKFQFSDERLEAFCKSNRR
jgi:hypothetical protein